MTEAASPLPAEAGGSLPLSRREFLYYLWGVSMAVAIAGAAGATIWFALPRFKEGEFGGVVTVPVGELPPPDSEPQPFSAGRFWLVNIGEQTEQDPRQPPVYPLTPGVKALYMVCVHLGCLYKWVPTNDRFECPCHGSKYLKSDARIDGPARRNLDVFVIEAVNANGDVVGRTEPQMGSSEGSSVLITPEVVSLRVDTGRKIVGAPNLKPGGGI
ncbi:MAG TPA: Rieske 2Fe-2S domain-containing protein [Anaerolineales bacterium]|nr:Rieske 2Fe-2S domain-containing protein [Anaerolineales bacterium]